uniref:Uncharacterized protein LOC104233316 n=1 Tax=Nicotiana sylvestris TaxID=4096 RepID=A0A1U7WYM2_NICSY|nr:PREDICTED: uncharacterized protein LOC104233316 [Nicotiana sylvestris]
MPPRISHMQSQFPAHNKPRGREICHGHNSDASSESCSRGSGHQGMVAMEAVTQQILVPTEMVTFSPNCMNFIIWNCMGSHNAEFRRHFRSLLDNHRPTLAILLEMHMQDHTVLRDDFQFTNMSQVPTNGLIGGLVVLWHDTLINVEELRMSEQEIHCLVQVHILDFKHVKIDSRSISLLRKNGDYVLFHQMFLSFSFFRFVLSISISICLEYSCSLNHEFYIETVMDYHVVFTDFRLFNS